MPILCRNCGSVNPDGSLSCAHCSIEGHFQPIETPSQKAPFENRSQPSPAPSACKNCGEPHDRSLGACPKCFWQPAKIAAPKGLLHFAPFSFDN